MSDNEGNPVGDGRGASVPPGASAHPAAREASVPPASGASVPPAGTSPEGTEAVVAAEQSEADKLSADLEKAKAEAAKYREQLLRTAADFDNFRKRVRKDVEDASRKGLERALLEVLPVSDNLERAVQAATGATDVAGILEGVRMVLRFFEDALGRLGVERVPSVGTPFDPGLHEAVQQVESDEPPGTVVAELAPGYRLGTKLLRAAMVGVARPRTTDGAGTGSSVSGAQEGQPN